VINTLNQSTNVIALLVIGMGVAISVKNPSLGHDLITGGLGALGGAAASARFPQLSSIDQPKP
jgi:hypothetical protein